MRAIEPPKGLNEDERRIWCIIDGAIRDSFNSHPEYRRGNSVDSSLRMSILKRAMGHLKGLRESEG